MTTTQFTRQFIAFTIRFLIAAPAVFFSMVGLHLAEGYTVPVGLGMCMLAALVITFLEPRVQHILRIRIDNDRRIYINDIPYYRIVLAASGVAIFSALVLLATGRFGSFVGDFLNVFRSFNR